MVIITIIVQLGLKLDNMEGGYNRWRVNWWVIVLVNRLVILMIVLDRMLIFCFVVESYILDNFIIIFDYLIVTFIDIIFRGSSNKANITFR